MQKTRKQIFFTHTKKEQCEMQKREKLLLKNCVLEMLFSFASAYSK